MATKLNLVDRIVNSVNSAITKTALAISRIFDSIVNVIITTSGAPMRLAFFCFIGFLLLDLILIGKLGFIGFLISQITALVAALAQMPISMAIIIVILVVFLFSKK